jgi:hypothetical protein
LVWRTSAVYDLASLDDNLESAAMEQYAYDPLWRMVAIYRRLAVDPQTGQRPPSPLRSSTSASSTTRRHALTRNDTRRHAAGTGGASSTRAGRPAQVATRRSRPQLSDAAEA